MAAAEVDNAVEMEKETPEHHPVAEGHVEDQVRNGEDDEVDTGAVPSEDPGSAKKRKFKPWKSLRNFFKKKRSEKDEVEADESFGVKSKSTGELNRPDTDAENDADGKDTCATSLQSPSLKAVSLSADCVFSSEKPASTKEDPKSAEMNMPSAIASELSAKLKGRSGSDEVQEKSAQEHPDETRTPEPKAMPPKPAPRSSEKRPTIGMSMDDEKSFSAATHEKKQEPEIRTPIKPSEDKGSDDFDFIVSTHLLENTAARHRISVAPRARRASSRPGQRPAKRPATTHEAVPKSSDTPKALKGKRSPASPISPISPGAVKTKLISAKSSKEPKPKFPFTKDEASPDDKEADSQKDAVSPVKKKQESQNEEVPEITSPKMLPSPQDVTSPKEATPSKEHFSPKEVIEYSNQIALPTTKPLNEVAESPKKLESPKHEMSQMGPEELLPQKDTPSTEDKVLPEASSPGTSSTPTEVSSPKMSSPTELTSPVETASPRKTSSPEHQVERLSVLSEDNQDSRDSKSFQDTPLSDNVLSPKESKTEDHAERDKEKRVLPPVQRKPTEKKPVEKEPLNKPGLTPKPKVEKPAAPKRGNVRANMALFEQKTVATKPAVSDSSSAPRAAQRRSLVASQKASSEEPSKSKPEEKPINQNAQGQVRKPAKKPVSLPKEKDLSEPVNAQDKTDTRDEEQSKEKPLSLKDRLSKFQSASSRSAINAPVPWKTRSNSDKEEINTESDKQLPKESAQQTSEKQDDDTSFVENSNMPETRVDRQSESELTASDDTREDDKANEEQHLSSHLCKNSNRDEDSGSLSMSSNRPISNDSPSKEGIDTSSNDNQGTTISMSGSKSSPKKHGFVPKTEHCVACQRPVYLTEMAKAEGKTFHKGCQRCTECSRTLLIGNLLLVDGRIYCKLHGTQMKNKLLKMRLEID